ncbi:MAG: VWA domain-containing protein [Candidatus Omnitrophota bacterium]|nr:MAG: VWA domain-containing protein [Candidatus Omnitrophota bacterium]
MRFGNLSALHWLWVIVGVGIFFVWAYKHRRKLLMRFAHQQVLGQISLSFSLKKYRLKAILLVTAIFFLLIALLQPQWGFHWREVKRKGVDILIAVDVSKSMLAQDIKPNRLERSKLAIKDLVKKLKGDRIGLISFAGTSFLQCPLTLDYPGFLFILEDLGVDTIPRGGTSISSALREAIGGYEGGEKKHKVLVLITDGEDHEGNPLKLVEEAEKEGINIFCIGIGTQEGELISIVNDKGKKSFLKDKNGNVVKTRLNQEILQKIALKTGGSYLKATPLNFGLNLIYDKKISKMEKKEFTGKMAKFYEERFGVFLFLALCLLILEFFITTYQDESLHKK